MKIEIVNENYVKEPGFVACATVGVSNAQFAKTTAFGLPYVLDSDKFRMSLQGFSSPAQYWHH